MTSSSNSTSSLSCDSSPLVRVWLFVDHHTVFKNNRDLDINFSSGRTYFLRRRFPEISLLGVFVEDFEM